MSAQHTPGPWEARKARTHFYIWARHRLVASVRYLAFTDGWTSERDAHVLAAAPQMLDALEWAERAISENHLRDQQVRTNVLNAIRAAIAKATGGAA